MISLLTSSRIQEPGAEMIKKIEIRKKSSNKASTSRDEFMNVSGAYESPADWRSGQCLLIMGWTSMMEQRKHLWIPGKG